MTDKLRQAIEQAVAILGPEAPLCSGCVDEWTEALRILNDALAAPDPDPVTYNGWVLREVLFDNGEPVGHREPTKAEPQEPVASAISAVIAAMQADPEYAWSWHCNVAMAFVDAGGDHYTANQGAARFMRLLANVEPAHDLPEAPQPAKREPLTDEQIGAVLAVAFPDDAEPDGSWKLARYELDIFRAAEAAHGIGVSE